MAILFGWNEDVASDRENEEEEPQMPFENPPHIRQLIRQYRGNTVAPQCEGVHDASELCEDCDEDAPQISFWCRREQHDRCGDPMCDDLCHEESEEA